MPKKSTTPEWNQSPGIQVQPRFSHTQVPMWAGTQPQVSWGTRNNWPLIRTYSALKKGRAELANRSSAGFQT